MQKLRRPHTSQFTSIADFGYLFMMKRSRSGPSSPPLQSPAQSSPTKAVSSTTSSKKRRRVGARMSVAGRAPRKVPAKTVDHVNEGSKPPTTKGEDVLEISSEDHSTFGREDGDVIELSDSSPEDLVNLPLQPGDSEYVGPRRPTSRVVSRDREVTPPLTRRRARLLPSVVIHSPPSDPEGRKRRAPGPTARSLRSKTIKASQAYDYDLKFTEMGPSPSRVLFLTPPPLTSTDSDDVPEVSSSFKKHQPAVQPTVSTVSQLSENESIASGGDSRNDNSSPSWYASDEDPHAVLSDGEGKGDTRVQRSSSDSSAWLDDGEEWGGIDDSHHAAESESRTSTISVSPKLVPSLNTEDRRAFAQQQSAQHSVQQAPPSPSPSTNPVGSSAPQFTSSRSPLSQSKSGSSVSKKMEERKRTAKQGSVSKAKGKARAHSVPADEEERASGSTPEEMLSDHEVQMRQAIRNSLSDRHRPLKQPFLSTSTTSGPSTSTPSGSNTQLFTPPATSSRQGPPVQVSPVTPTPKGSSGPLPKVLIYDQKAAASNATPGRDSTGIKHYCLSLPARDEVNSPDIQDEVLAGDYGRLPHLRSGILIPLSESYAPGHARFSAWSSILEDVTMESVWSAIRFDQVAGTPFINPCRASPLNVDCKEALKDRRYVLLRNGVPLIAVVSGGVEWSQLTHLGNGPVQLKHLRLLLHSQEFERYCAWICMVFPVPQIFGHVWEGTLQISTRSVSQSKKTRISSLYMKREDDGSHQGLSSDAFSLPPHADVPVYDARASTAIDFNTDIPNLDALLPRFFGEIPSNSLVVVAHTLTIYKSTAGPHKDKWCFGPNIQWVVLLGTPSAKALADAEASARDDA
ncbi:hypothetical protein MD484_g8604, partial [Candolleomyces efflorescens]